jgi:3-hydroxyisobutyrate dehydrogenase
MAVKAINNIMNTAHLCVATEALLCLKNFGVDPETALEVINASGGRSLATQERVPRDVLSGSFSYGFALDLMAKDCLMARDLLQEHFPTSTVLKECYSIIRAAEQEEGAGAGEGEGRSSRDYTEAARYLERKAGTQLRMK